MTATRPEQLYETHFYAWTQAQVKELRRFAGTRPNLPLDLAHIAEEIRDLGRSEYEAVFSLVQRVLRRFLLIQHSPAWISASIEPARSTGSAISSSAGCRPPSGAG